ncbi:hypothetical protein AOQ84DRAFT_417231 [Glonium stellatum]|uniref:Uncharacterized protein n=1 Tax=Glonium stellatum TaxID=574774 RepID=A0A8E2ESF9_9PEZI|nr:hypothetical protein AOQ84DRAFT_417231 [Glonium stellatum]
MTIKGGHKGQNARQRQAPYSLLKPPQVIFLSWFAVGLSLACAQLILNYHRLHPVRSAKLLVYRNNYERLLSEWINQLPSFISSPTPLAFVVATLTYGMSTLAFYRLHEDDRYQTWFMMSGILLAVLMGSLNAMDFQGIILGFAPWCITTSLILSACVHRMLGRDRGWKGVVDAEMQGAKDCA